VTSQARERPFVCLQTDNRQSKPPNALRAGPSQCALAICCEQTKAHSEHLLLGVCNGRLDDAAAAELQPSIQRWCNCGGVKFNEKSAMSRRLNDSGIEFNKAPYWRHFFVSQSHNKRPAKRRGRGNGSGQIVIRRARTVSVSQCIAKERRQLCAWAAHKPRSLIQPESIQPMCRPQSCGLRWLLGRPTIRHPFPPDLAVSVSAS